MARTLNDIAEAEKLVDAGFGAVAVSDDLGKHIPIVFGRAIKVPALYIKADEASREYDYILAEGVGLNSNNFEEVFTAYRDERAFDVILGDVQAATSTTVDLESADQRPNQWYQYWFIEITAGTGIGQIRDINDYDGDNNRITVSSAWSTTPDATSDYKLTEYRFFDGSQSSPYNGMTCLRFKKRIGTQGRTEKIHADCNGFQDEVNRVRAIQSILTNTVWGLGLTVNTTSFDSAATTVNTITTLSCEGAIVNESRALDVIRKLLAWRDMTLTKADDIEIAVDVAKSSTFDFYHETDLVKSSIVTREPRLVTIHPDQQVKNLKIRYRNNYQTNNFQHEFTRSSSDFGIDQNYDEGFIYDHTAADITLDYKRKRFAQLQQTLNLEIGMVGNTVKRADMGTVIINSIGVNGFWEVLNSTVSPSGNNLFNLIKYSANAYSYVSFVSDGGVLPVDESFAIAPDFSKTNPDPVSSVNVVGGFDTQENGTKVGFLDVTWTPPNDGNYSGARVFVKVNGEPATAYQSVGIGVDNFRVPSLEVGQAYDVLVVSLNIDGSLEGLGTEDLNTLVPGDTTPPNAPTGLTFDGAVFGTLHWSFTASSSTDVVAYEYQIDNVSSFATPIFDGEAPDLKIDFPASTSNSLSGVTRWCRVRAIDRAGNPSSWTTGVSGSTDSILQGDIIDNEITDVVDASSAGPTTGSGITLVSATINVRGHAVEIWAYVNVSNDSLAPSSGNSIIIRRGTTTLRSINSVHRGFNNGDTTVVAIHWVDESPGSGNKTYKLDAGNNDSQTYTDMYISVEDLRR